MSREKINFKKDSLPPFRLMEEPENLFLKIMKGKLLGSYHFKAETGYLLMGK